MAVQVRARQAVLAERKAAKERNSSRNQMIALGVCGAILLVVLAVELPGFGGGGGAAVPAPAAAVGAGAVVVPPAVPLTSPRSLARIARRPARDPFVPQVNLPATGSTGQSASAATEELTGPSVRAHNFVSKDPFVPQIAPPAAAVGVSGSPGSSVAVTPLPINLAVPGSGYVVVLAAEPGAEGQAAVARAVVAAENAGLPDVKSSLLHAREGGGSLDVYMGPYPTAAVAQQELIRALRVGYSLASVQALAGAGAAL